MALVGAAVVFVYYGCLAVALEVDHYWKEGRLICQHTNLLSGRRKSREGNEQNHSVEENGESEVEFNEEELQAKRDEEERQLKSE